MEKRMSEEEVNYIYIGPTVAKMGLKKSTIIKGSIPPPQLQSLIDLKPMIKSLFIPTAKIAEARDKVDRLGTIENLAAQAVVEMGRTRDSNVKKG